MSKKKKKQGAEKTVLLSKIQPLKQLWITERKDLVPRTRAYFFSDRWFDVREAAGLLLKTNGDYSLLFISVVMAPPEEVALFAEDKNLVGVFDIFYTGNAVTESIKKHVVRVVKG